MSGEIEKETYKYPTEKVGTATLLQLCVWEEPDGLVGKDVDKFMPVEDLECRQGSSGLV